MGGASVTEETFPGFRISTAAMVGGLLKPKIAADLELHKFGYGPLVPYDPVALQLYPDNRYMFWWSDPVKTLDEFAKFSRKDGEAFLDLRKRMDRLAAVLKPLELRPPMSVEEIARKFPDPEGRLLLSGSIGESYERLPRRPLRDRGKRRPASARMAW